jgi:hypothetical protein
VKNKCYTSKMALELSEQACRMCNGEFAYALQALLDAHPGIDLYLFEREGCYNIMGEAPFINRQSAYKCCSTSRRM